MIITSPFFFPPPPPPEYQNTNVEGVHALGDVCGRVQLTPMAIAAGRRLADRLFGKRPLSKVSNVGSYML